MSDLVIAILIIVGYVVVAVLLYALFWTLASKDYIDIEMVIGYGWTTALWPIVLIFAPFGFVLWITAQGGLWLFCKAFDKIIPEKKKKKKDGKVSVR